MAVAARASQICSIEGAKNFILPVTAVAVTGALVLIGTLRLEGEKIVLRDSSEALSFAQDLFDLLGMILPK